MGNGSRIIVDIESSSLTQDDLEKAAQVALNNFGRNPIIMIPAGMITTMPWQAHPQYAETPWAHKDRLTKREHAVAKLHTILTKLKVLSFKEEEFYEIRKLSIKRLKRARWARY